jgi:predicted glycogen debranching enzyme
VALRSLPALIATRAFDPATAALRGYAEYLDEGVAPESFDGSDGTPRYGDPEPSLWMVHAGELLARRGADLDLVKDSLFPVLESVMQSYRAGTRHGIRVDSDGLLMAGEGEHAAKRADLNALWYHALVAMAQLARLVGQKEGGAFYLAWARDHQKRFHEAFYGEGRELPYAALTDAGPVTTLEPGLLRMVSLPPALLAPERRVALVEAIERELWTPWGLRAAPGERRVSPAAIGDFLTAYLRAHRRAPDAQARARQWLEQLESHLGDGMALHLPESFELSDSGDTARPTGAPASTIAAAELLRVWIEEVSHAEEPAGVA